MVAQILLAVDAENSELKAEEAVFRIKVAWSGGSNLGSNLPSFSSEFATQNTQN